MEVGFSPWIVAALAYKAAPALSRAETSLPSELFAALPTEHAQAREPLATLLIRPSPSPAHPSPSLLVP